MIKKKLVFSIFWLIIILINTACNGPSTEIADLPKSKFFVSIVNGKFTLEGKEFYPVALNYAVSLQENNGNCWPAPSRSYRSNDIDYTNKDSSLKELQADFELIKEMGFNTIRLVGIGEPQYGKSDEELFFSAFTGRGGQQISIILDSDKNYEEYFNALEKVFEIANKAGLKVIFLVRLINEMPYTEKHVIKVMQHFKTDSTIFAYDLFNEPLYFDSLERDKKDIYYITQKWDSLAKSNAPNQLTTIGLTGIREVFEWDPNLLHVDFLSIHPYEYEPEEVRNEIYWYGKYIKKPWIIGETAIPADNDSVSYESQSTFAKNTLEQTYNCGGIGYSWWQYKDVEWSDFHANYLGIVNNKGYTMNREGKRVIGTPKPVVDIFKKYKPAKEKGECLCLDNYYNYSGYKDCRLKGVLHDESGEPIEGGVVLAWNESWSKSFHTVTKKDGSFELFGNFQFYHWKATATKYTMIRGEIEAGATKNDANDNMPTIDLGKLEVKLLDF